MNFLQAITSGFSNYVNFSARAIRSEYWYWVLFTTVGAFVTAFIDRMDGVVALYPLFGLATILPSIAIGVRRLHDLDRSGWWLLLGFVPVIGAIVLIIWFCYGGTPAANRFGPDRLASLAPLSPRSAI
jgi:uncharacterized membrane protein YhaH (DUF805 family)